MNIRHLVVFLVLSAGYGVASAQGMMSDVMSGKLVNPQVGAFAWYNLTDVSTGKTYFLRQAIVGQDRVKRKDAYWLETELIPKVGFPSVYKMLLTGPASNPRNVHRLLVREGTGVVQEVSLDQMGDAPDVDEAPRELAGTETIDLPGGSIEAEHYIVGGGAEKTELWVSEEVPPLGVVRMKTPQGELSLQRYGVGGKDGESALPMPGDGGDVDGDAVDADGDGDEDVQTNFRGRKRGRR